MSTTTWQKGVSKTIHFDEESMRILEETRRYTEVSVSGAVRQRIKDSARMEMVLDRHGIDWRAEAKSMNESPAG